MSFWSELSPWLLVFLKPDCIRTILCSSGHAFVTDEMFTADDRYSKPIHLCRDAISPGFFKLHTIYLSQNIDATRGDTNLYDHTLNQKVLHGNVGKRRSEPRKCSQYFVGILLAAPHPEIDIACGAREPMHRQCIGTDQQELNACIYELGENVVEVRIEQLVSP